MGASISLVSPEKTEPTMDGDLDTYMYQIYCKELAHMVTEAEQSQDLHLAGRGAGRAEGGRSSPRAETFLRSSCALFRPSVDWRGPWHAGKGSQLYSVY